MKPVLTAALILALCGAAACDDEEPPADVKSGPTVCTAIDATMRSGTEVTDDLPGVRCMRDALASRRAATVKITYSTVEGDPILQTYLLAPDGRVSMTIDASKDAFRGNGPEITEVACTKPRWLPGAECPPPEKRPALFTVVPGQEVTRRTRALDVLVHPVWCTNGRTGKILPPVVSERSISVDVLFRISNRPARHGSCRGVPPIPYRLELGQPLGDRWLVDQGCTMPGTAGRPLCQKSKVRARTGVAPRGQTTG